MSHRLELMKLLGQKCVKCDVIDVQILQIHHVDDDGNIERARFGSSEAEYAYYLNHPEEAVSKLEVRCANHNWKQRYGEQLRRDVTPVPAIPREKRMSWQQSAVFSRKARIESLKELIFSSGEDRLEHLKAKFALETSVSSRKVDEYLRILIDANIVKTEERRDKDWNYTMWVMKA